MDQSIEIQSAASEVQVSQFENKIKMRPQKWLCSSVYMRLGYVPRSGNFSRGLNALSTWQVAEQRAQWSAQNYSIERPNASGHVSRMCQLSGIYLGLQMFDFCLLYFFIFYFLPSFAISARQKFLVSRKLPVYLYFVGVLLFDHNPS